MPEESVRQAQHHSRQGRSVGFNEPTLSLEWSLDALLLACTHGLYKTYVTKGFVTPEPLRLLVEAGLGAMNVDVKGHAADVRRRSDADVERVWLSFELAVQAGMWLEVTTLVIPGPND